jgi:hypothetical protein
MKQSEGVIISVLENGEDPRNSEVPKNPEE